MTPGGPWSPVASVTVCVLSTPPRGSILNTDRFPWALGAEHQRSSAIHVSCLQLLKSSTSTQPTSPDSLELNWSYSIENVTGIAREEIEKVKKGIFFFFKAVIIWVWDAPSGSCAWTTGPQVMALFCGCSIFKRQGLPERCSHPGAGCQVCTAAPLSVSKPLMLLPLQTWAALTRSQNQPSSLKLSLGFGHCYDLSCSPSATLGRSST